MPTTQNLINNLRESTIKKDLIPATRKNLSDVEIDSHMKIKGELFRVIAATTATETNKSFSKRKKYVVTEYTLLSIKDATTRFVEWAYDDELEICFTEKKVKAAEIGFSEDQIMSKENISFEGNTYYYTEKWHGIFSDGDEEQFVVFYEYEDSSDGMLTFEGWSEDTSLHDVDYEVFLSSNLGPQDIFLC